MTVIQRTIKKLKDGVSGLLVGVSLDNVSDLYGKFEEGLSSLQQKATLPEAMTSNVITIYDGVTDYIAPKPIFGSTIKDIRPVGQYRQSWDTPYRKSGSDFDLEKGHSPSSGYNVTFETENGINIMRVKTRFCPTRIVLDTMGLVTGWVASESASGIVQDTSFYYHNPASLRFTLTGASTGYLTKTLTNTVDMTSFLNVGVVFLPLELQTAALTSVELRLGSSSSAYWTLTVTQAQLGAWRTGQFDDTPFDLSLATKVGSPDITKINYIRLGFTTSATIPNVRAGYLSCSMPSQHKVLFTTNGIFQATDLTINNFITDDNDVILLNDAAYNLFKYECAMSVGLGEGGTLAGGLLGTINSKLNGARSRTGQIIQLGLYDIFRAKNQSEDIEQVGNWYND